MTRIFPSTLILLSIIFSWPAIVIAEDRSLSVDRLGIQFDYPAGFIPRRFREEKLPEAVNIEGYNSPFKNAVVLVEPDQLKTYSGQEFSVEGIPVGEIPVIWLDRLRGGKAKFMKAILKEGQKKTIGGHTVYQLPGFPGPYGDAAFYYLIPISGGDLLEIGAHRFYFRGIHPKSTEPPKTTYDRTIEQVIGTLEFTPSP